MTFMSPIVHEPCDRVLVAPTDRIELDDVDLGQVWGARSGDADVFDADDRSGVGLQPGNRAPRLTPPLHR